MAIIRLEDKYKSKYKIQLTPQRHFSSSSSGITGSVHVFPNRSETQKDNIDERLNLAPMAEEGTEFSGKPIRPYDSNSLEARRIEIYQGQFGKLIGGMFSDAIQYEYTRVTAGAWSDGVSGAISKTGESINASITFSTNDIVERTTGRVQFQWTSNNNWVDYPNKSDVPLNKLLESDRDTSGKNFEIALGLLLDGANPFTEDHAWRYGGDPNQYSNAGNSSFTGGAPADYQFTGFKVITDELGIPYQDSPLTKKSEVNAWPPEIAKWNTSIISNFVVQGYSDLSMHPRNATKKDIIRRRADFNVFSSGSLMQKTLVNRLDDLYAAESGWWVHNNQVLSLSEYSDGGTNRVPALCYHNDASQYEIDWQSDEITYEFWIKPCKEQVAAGTIAHLGGNFGITVVPDITTKKNAYYEKFKLGFFFGTKAVNSIDPGSITSSVNAAGSADGVYITASVLNLDNWHHVVLRYGANFNNGLLDVFVDGVSITGGDLDGSHIPGNAKRNVKGFINTTVAAASGHSVTIGAWPPTSGMEDIFGVYADKQEYSVASNSTSYADGLSVTPRYQLKSELGDFRIWSTCRSEAETLASKYSTLESNTGLKFYVNFQLDPSSSSPTWNHKGFVPNKDTADNTAEYYSQGSLTNISSSALQNGYNKTSFCTNSAFIAGMPFINVHAHAKEYAKSNWPVITGFQDLTDIGAATLYPTINNQSPATEKILYFQNHWESFGWLQCINSILVPSDNEKLVQKYTLNSRLYHHDIEADMIKLNGAGIGNANDPLEIQHFLDDEVFSIQDSMVKLDPSIVTFGGKEENYQTKSLIANKKLSDNDFMSPISTVISIPQIYYGNRIHEESIEITFNINEDGKIIKLVDRDGTLYRINSKGVGVSKVGHVDYANGIICIISALLVNIGLDNFDIKLKGQKNMHVMQLDIPCGPGIANKSQNPTYKSLKASANANETSGKLTYISSIYLHDENLNIIGKVNLAQPVQKREEDSFIFRVKVDF